MKRTLARGSLFLAAAALATSGLVASPAGAAAAQQTCKTLTGTVNIKPGISPVARPQTATAKAAVKGCAPASKTGGSGNMTATLKLPKDSSCTGLVNGGVSLKLTSKIAWKNKKTSNLALTAKTGKGSAAAILTATITGKVSAGLFKGRPVTGQIKIKPAAGQDCFTKPVTKITFTNSKPLVIK